MVDALHDEEIPCPKCQQTMVWRPKYPFPVVLQVVFGVSFLLFVLFVEKLPSRALVYAWTAAQILLGGLLIFGRARARQKVLRCIKCGSGLR